MSLLDDPLVRCIVHGWIEPSGLHECGEMLYRLTDRGRAAMGVEAGQSRADSGGNAMDTTLWIHLRGLTFGLVARDGLIVQAAPVAAYTEGWTIERAITYFRGRGAQIETI